MRHAPASSSPVVTILGCGYTGERVARLLLARGVRVICTSRHPERLAAALPGAEPVYFELEHEDPVGKAVEFVPHGSAIVYSIPPAPGFDSSGHWEALRDRAPARVVYISTTGVYGDQFSVDEKSEAAPRDEHDRERLSAEAAVLGGPWSSIVLRPAAIYGPGRGIHESMRRGAFRLVGDGGNFVSRIHVDDLAAHVEAALWSGEGGTWPVADEQPCTSREIAEYCATVLGIRAPDAVPAAAAHRTRRANRQVDGRAIRSLLGVRLLYPGYREGIQSSL